MTKNHVLYSLFSLLFLLSCFSSQQEIKPIETAYSTCDRIEYNLYGHDYEDIVKVWGEPTDSLYASKKLPKHKGKTDSWYIVAYAWSDTSKVKVEGKTTIKLIFEATWDGKKTYKPIKGNNGIAPTCECYPL